MSQSCFPVEFFCMNHFFYEGTFLSSCHRYFQSVKIYQFQCILRYFIDGLISGKRCYCKKFYLILMRCCIRQCNTIIDPRIAVHDNLYFLSHIFTLVKTFPKFIYTVLKNSAVIIFISAVYLSSSITESKKSVKI